MAHQSRAKSTDKLLFDGLESRGFRAALVHAPAGSKVAIWELSL
jgi:hypothetical protein